MKHRFVVVGANMVRLLSAINLRKAGFTDITVYEKADPLSGTWRETRIQLIDLLRQDVRRSVCARSCRVLIWARGTGSTPAASRCT